ncbi:MAG: hypothetical protein WCK85_04280 [Chlorobium sp.]
MRVLLFCWILFVFNSAYGESYRDIGALDNLGDIKNRFPNAKVEKLSPGWAQAKDALYKFTGEGMSGNLIIKFDDYRFEYKDAIEKDPTSQNAELLQNLSQQSDDAAMSVSWVRWVPDTKIPLQRLIAKYGKPEKSGFSNEDYQPYRSWDKKGLEAYLSDDEKYVVRIDFFFTRQEYRNAYLSKYKFVPDWLKDKPTPIKQK